nr:RNA-directed DNA polymerase, eukaryota, reverse transcriptase zinc-binding domain protein [Tanacetum cinerariifolium]
KKQWKIDRQKKEEEMNVDIEDVMEGTSGIAKELSTEEIEEVDVNSSGLHCTWIKSPSKPKTGIIKNLDRVMAIMEFIDKDSILFHFGFHEKIIGWIMTYVISASFSICINEERYGYIKSGRGLRQGDSMSPYLFTLVMEVLPMIIQIR